MTKSMYFSPYILYAHLQVVVAHTKGNFSLPWNIENLLCVVGILIFQCRSTQDIRRIFLQICFFL